jgi:hypothetical protein
MAEGFVLSTSGKPTIVKDPNAVLDYTFDWTAWLTGGDFIISIAPAIDSSPTTAAIVASFHDTTHVTLWVAGGTVGEKVALRCRISTASGRTDDRTGYLKIKER